MLKSKGSKSYTQYTNKDYNLLKMYIEEKLPTDKSDIIKLISSGKLDLTEIELLITYSVNSKNPKFAKILIDNFSAQISAKYFRSLLITTAEAKLPKLLEYLCVNSKIPVEIKYAAINAPIYTLLNGSKKSGSINSILGALEIEIKRQHYVKESKNKEVNSSRSLKSTVFQEDLQVYRNIELANDRNYHRSTNPAGLTNAFSFAEIVEKTFADLSSKKSKKYSINIVINRALKSWSADKPFTRESLSRHIKELHPKCLTITNPNLYSWKNKPWKSPCRKSIAILVKAFKLEEKHELMLWKIANRNKLNKPIDYYIERARSDLGTKNERKARGQLVTALVNYSGISHSRLEELLSVQQLSMWKLGAKIENAQRALRFVELVLGINIYSDKNVTRTNLVYSLLHGSNLNFEDAFSKSRNKKNPTGYFLKAITGRNGILPLSTSELAKMLSVSSTKIQRMRNSSKIRGSKIFEEQAIKIAGHILDQSISQCIDQSIISNTDFKSQFELLTEGLTGFPGPEKLYTQYQNGKLSHVGEVLKRTRLRRGIKQLPNTSEFELGKSFVGLRKATEIANFIGFTEEQKSLRREFILEATGFRQIRDPLSILESVENKLVSKHIALRKLLDQTGKNRSSTADSLGISHSVLNHLVTVKSGGKIRKLSIATALAKEVGLEKYKDRFLAVFFYRNINNRS
jgi:hypothetical protein